MLKITIEGEAKEIAALFAAGRQEAGIGKLYSSAEVKEVLSESIQKAAAMTSNMNFCD